MENKDLGLLAILGALFAYLYYQNSQTPSSDNASDSAVSFTSDPLASIGDSIVSTTIGWKNAGDAQQWLPALNTAESQFGIPADLLARIAYQESHFRNDVITGATASPAGALGLMQLMPQYFTTVRVPRPFQPSDTLAQIQEAGQLLANNFKTLGTWPLAVAAYNAGVGTVQSGNASAANKSATQNYVAAILADIPAANA
jgi:soluble lytic murein transglycosylase-like protein